MIVGKNEDSNAHLNHSLFYEVLRREGVNGVYKCIINE